MNTPIHKSLKKPPPPRRPRTPTALIFQDSAPPPAPSLYEDDSATLDDLREAITTLEETARTARRVLGSAHPVKFGIEEALRDARAALRARETPSPR